VVVLATALLTAWRLSEGPSEPASASASSPARRQLADAGGAPGTPAPPTARVRVQGTFVDETGAPVTGGEVLAFAHGQAWLSEGPSACDLSPFTCFTLDAAEAIIADARHGALPFPEPLARARTDATGAFAFDDLPSDAFLLGVAGKRQTASRLGTTEKVELRLLPPDDEALDAQLSVFLGDTRGANVEVVIINPFTREVEFARTNEDGQHQTKVPGSLWWAGAWAPGSDVAFKRAADRHALVLAPPRSLRVRLKSSAGAVDGDVRLRCSNFERRGGTDGGIAVFDRIPASQCSVLGTAGALSSPWTTISVGGAAELDLLLSPEGTLAVTLVDDETGGPVGAGMLLMRPVGLQRRPTGVPVKAGERKVLAGLSLTTYELQAHVSGYLAESTHVRVGPGETETELRLRRALEVTGRVVDSQGVPVSKVSISARRAGAGPPASTSQPDGSFLLALPAPGPWELVAEHHEAGRARATVTAPARDVVLSLAPTNLLVMKVEGARDSAEVELVPLEVAGEVSWPRTFIARGAEPVLRAELPAGRYLVRARADGRTPAFEEVSVPATGRVNLTLTLTPTVSLSGVVLDPAGRPRPRAHLRATAMHEPDPRRVAPSWETTSDARGRFTFADVAKSELKVEATSDDLQASLVVTPPRADVRLVMAPAPRWSGRAVDPQGHPIEKLKVNNKPFSAPGGRFDVAARWLELEADGRSASFRGEPRDLGDVTLRGQLPVAFRVLRPDGQPAVGARVLFRGVGHYSRSTDTEGRLTYGLPEGQDDGRLALSALHSEGYAFFTATTAGETTVTLTPWLRVAGRVENTEGEGMADEVVASSLEFAHELAVTTTSDGRFTAHVAPGLWAFRARHSRLSRVVRVESGQERIVLRPGPSTCELSLTGDSRATADAVLTLTRTPGTGAVLRFGYSPGVAAPLECGWWEARLERPGTPAAFSRIELRPGTPLTLAPEASDCRYVTPPCVVLGAAAQ
jgi:hypothetical protein